LKALAFHEHGGLDIVDTVMPLKDGVEARRRLAEGKQFGKIVLTP
jgi:NADPH:quinone reductase-like Zn-dependent oxidoreductase